MVDGDAVEQWQLDTVKLLIDNGIELSLIIKNGDDSKPYKSFSDKLLHYPYRQILFRIWHRYFFKPKAKKRINIKNEISPLRFAPVEMTSEDGVISTEVEKSPASMTVMPIIKGISSVEFSFR